MTRSPCRPFEPGGRFALGALLAASLALAACGSRPPIIRVEESAIEDQGSDATRVGVTLTLENPNDNELVLERFNYRVIGDRTYSGERRAGLTLGPKTSARLVVPAVLGTGTSARDARIDGSVLYRSTKPVEAALFEAGILRPRAGFGGAVRAK